MYELKRHTNPTDLKNLSLSTLLTTGRNKQIKSKILIILETGPKTARQLSEAIGCMRSSVCFALKKLSLNGLINDQSCSFDYMTERTVTLYSLVSGQVP